MSVVGNSNIGYSLFSPGMMKWSIVIMKKTGRDTMDENGFPVVGWEQVHKLRAYRSTISTREAIMADKDNDKPMLKFVCRKRDDIDEKMFVQFNSKMYDIQHLHILDDFFIELTVTEYLGE